MGGRYLTAWVVHDHATDFRVAVEHDSACLLGVQGIGDFRQGDFKDVFAIHGLYQGKRYTVEHAETLCAGAGLCKQFRVGDSNRNLIGERDSRLLRL